MIVLVLSCASSRGPGDPGTDTGFPDAPDAHDAAADAPAEIQGPPATLWDDFAPAPPVRGSLFQTRPDLGDFLAMRFHQPAATPRPDPGERPGPPSRPPPSHLGDFGVGNGRVLDPLETSTVLHVGPAVGTLPDCVARPTRPHSAVMGASSGR